MSRPPEEWRPVPSAPSWYASSWGRVMLPSHRVPMPRGGFKVLEVAATKGRLDPTTGRYRISAKNRTRRVAQMVCEAFHGHRPSSRHECMHLDEDCANDDPLNLSWGTRSENQHAAGVQAWRRERMKSQNPLKVLSSYDVDCIKILRGKLRADLVAREFGICRGYVYQIWRGARG